MSSKLEFIYIEKHCKLPLKYHSLQSSSTQDHPRICASEARVREIIRGYALSEARVREIIRGSAL